MSATFSLPQGAILASALAPAADAAGRTGNYVDTTRAQRLWFVFHVNQGNAATVALSLSKATAIVGPTGATAGTAAHRIWVNQDAAASSAFARQADATSFTTSAAIKAKVIVIEVDPGSEGVAFTAVAPVTGPSNAANATSCLVYAMPRREGATLANAMID